MTDFMHNVPPGNEPVLPSQRPMVVSPRAPRPEKLLAIIRFLAPHSEKVVFSEHAQERMEERGISDVDVSRTLLRGSIAGPITPGNNEDEWCCKVTYQLRGSRDVGVATIVIQASSLWIKTVEWEDL
jgi:hypothetical protein